MAVKQEFAKVVESQLAVWQAQINEHQEALKQAGDKAGPTPAKPCSSWKRRPRRPGSG